MRYLKRSGSVTGLYGSGQRKCEAGEAQADKEVDDEEEEDEEDEDD